MRLLPNNKHEWIELVMTPFQVFALAVQVWLWAWKHGFRWTVEGMVTNRDFFINMWHTERHIFEQWYMACIAILFIGGAVQSCFGRRRAAWVNFGLAAVASVILHFYVTTMYDAK